MAKEDKVKESNKIIEKSKQTMKEQNHLNIKS